MKYDKAGTYELTYKAVDECGNEATATRAVIVEEAGCNYKEVINIQGAYTATNITPTALVDTWENTTAETEECPTLRATADSVSFTSGGRTYETSINNMYMDGVISNLMIVLSIATVGVLEDGVGVWFSQDKETGTFISHIGSEGEGDRVPDTITFNNLVVEQIVV